MTVKSKVVLKNAFLLKTVTKQNIKIKIISYIQFITKAAKRYHLTPVFLLCIKVHVQYKPWINTVSCFSALFPQNSI